MFNSLIIVRNRQFKVNSHYRWMTLHRIETYEHTLPSVKLALHIPKTSLNMSDYNLFRLIFRLAFICVQLGRRTKRQESTTANE